MDLNKTTPVSGLPDGTVEFNAITFNSNGSIASVPSPLGPAKEYTSDQVLKRTITHEMGHALLMSLDKPGLCVQPVGPPKSYSSQSFTPLYMMHLMSLQ
jgi:hypothetical protein